MQLMILGCSPGPVPILNFALFFCASVCASEYLSVYAHESAMPAEGRRGCQISGNCSYRWLAVRHTERVLGAYVQCSARALMLLMTEPALSRRLQGCSCIIKESE